MSGWGVASWLALAMYNVVLTALVFRQLGPAVFGLWAVIISIRTLLVLLDGGLALGVTRDAALSRDDPAARDRVASAYWLYLGIGVAALVLGLALAGLPSLLLHLSGSAVGQSRVVTMIVVVDAAVALASSPLSATIRGRGRFDILAVASIMQSAGGLLAAWQVIHPWGLPGVAGTALASRVIAGGFALGFLYKSGFMPWRWPASWSALGAVSRFAAPLIVLTIAGQLAMGTDIPIVGAFYGSIAAASYAVGAAIPATASALLFAILDVAFPSLSIADRSESARLVRWMLLLGSALGALGFTTLALNSAALLKVWVGAAPSLGVTVMVIYSASRLLNVPSHVLAIGAIAKGQHNVLAPLVICESLANFALSVLLAATYSPRGPAFATLVTLFVSNVIVLPLILRARLQVSLRAMGLQVLLGYGVGLASSLIVWLITAHLPGPLSQVIGAFIGTLLATVVIVVGGANVPKTSFRRMMIRLEGWRPEGRLRPAVRDPRARRLAERELQVGDDVAHVLDSGRDPDEPVPHP
jgi:O-antigen/teichoic acid export membrane protein